MPPQTATSSLRRALRIVGSPWIGMGLLAVICLYLSFVSVFTALSMRGLGTTESGLYAHPLLVVPAALAIVNLVAATVVRVPPRAASAGAWCSHLGVLVLAAGAAWYVSAKVRGVAVVERTPDGWTTIDHFYVDDTYAVYVSIAGKDGAAETLLPVDLADRDSAQSLDVPLAGLQGSTGARAVAYEPRAIPTIRLAVTDRQTARRWDLPQDGDEHGVVDCGDYLLYYHPDPRSAMAQARSFATARARATGRPVVAVAVCGTRTPLECVVLSPHARPRTAPLHVGRPTGAAVGSRTLGIELDRLSFCAAGRDGVPRRRRYKVRSFPAVCVALRGPAGPRKLYVPYDEYELNLDPVVVTTRDGRRARLRFARLRAPLPATVRTLSAEFLTHPGTRIPRDYRCEMETIDNDTTRRRTLSLNHPLELGPYQLSQGSWHPPDRPHEPTHIFLTVGSRPGLWLVWTGCILIGAGLPYAFYVKPLLRRRKRRRS